MSLWKKYSNSLSKTALNDLRVFLTCNTFPHTVIFARAFNKKEAYFIDKPLSINLFGNRGWEKKWPLVKSVRLIELLEHFKENGLNILNYLILKNQLLDTFIPDFFYLFFNRKKLNLEFLTFSNFLKNIFFINLLIIFYYILRKLKICLKILKKSSSNKLVKQSSPLRNLIEKNFSYWVQRFYSSAFIKILAG